MPSKLPEQLRVFIDSVNLKGFKSISEITVDFKKNFNILIGKNGSGKSNFLEALNQSLRYKEKITLDYALLNFLSQDDHSFKIEIEKHLRKPNTDKSDLDDRITFVEKFSIDNEVVYDNSLDDDLRRRFEFKNKKITYSANKTYLFHRMGYSSFYPLYIQFNLPENFNFISTPGSLKMDLDDTYGFFDFSNTLSFLPSIFWNLERHFDIDDVDEIKDKLLKKIAKTTTEDILNGLNLQEDILENLKLYSPIQDVRFNNNITVYYDEKNLSIENLRLEFKLNNTWMPWSQLSDGTKRLFYLITEITYSTGFILIEEPELGIHPHQFNLLMDFIKEQSEDKQIIISTHSPKALDHLSPEELNSILIASYDLKKGTQIRHLSSAEIKKAKKYMKEVGFFSDYWMLSDLEE